MRRAAFLGVDVGGTVTKATLYDTTGRCLASAEARDAVVTKARGFSERDPVRAWETTAEAIARAVRTVPRLRVAAVAVTGFGNGLLLVDESGHPVSPLVTSADTRAGAIVEQWRGEGVDAAVRERTWHEVWPGQPLPLLAWFAENTPEVVARATSFLACKDFIRARLTSEVAGEITDLSSAGLVDPADRAPATGVFDDTDLGELRRLLPSKILRSADVAGAVTAEAAAMTGLAAGTPVVAGMSDVLSVALGCGITDETRLSLVSGTWNINQRLVARDAEAPRPPESELFGTVVSDVPAALVAIDNNTAGAACLDWFLRSFAAGRATDYADCDTRAAAAIARGTGPIFLPFVHGLPTAPSACARFVGLAAAHDADDLIGALYEGVAFEHRVHVENIVGATGPVEAVRLGGGIVRSDAWTRLLADVLGLPVEIPDAAELGTLGASALAALGAGAFDDVSAAAAATTRVRRRVDPDPIRHELAAERYAIYQRERDAVVPRRRLEPLLDRDGGR